jgi:hypothetical protein
VEEVLKKAGVVAAAAAGLLMLAGPAFAGGEGHGYGDDYGYGGDDYNVANNQVGLINANDIDIVKDINLNAVLGACGNNVGILGAAVPILSPQSTGSCAAGGIVDHH